MPVYLDFETYSAADLREVGLHNYARHPATGVWCVAWALGDAEPEIITPENFTATSPLLEYVAAGGAVVAHNMAFEFEIWNVIMAQRYWWPELRPEQCHCTMAQAYAMGLPGGLGAAAEALGLPVEKDKAGRALMLRMARPRWTMPDGTHVWWNDADKLARLYDYCRRDVTVTRELYKRTRPLSETERRVWLLDGAINRRGMRVDGPSIRAALHMAEQLRAQYDAQMRELTGGAVASCNALGALKAWLAGHGLPGVQADLSKQVVAELLTRDYLTPEVRRALSLRQEAARASTAKLVPMANMAGEDGRLRHLFQYHGAATGRWAGRKVQPQNLPRDVPDADTVERILAHVRRGEYAEIAAAYGSPMAALSRCMRGLIVPAPGHCLVGGDYSAIEGRGTAWLAGEDWKLRTFWSADAGTGPGVYEATAGKILGIPPEQVTPAQRQAYGKVPELALGYQGGVGAFRIMARTYGVQISESEARDIIQRWRAEHPKTQQLWRDLERAAIHAVQNKGEVYSAGAPGRQIRFKAVGQFLWCRLPSGRVLCYPYPKLLPGAYGEQLTYMTALSQADKAKIIVDQANSTTWARVSTYGGSLTENVVQAVCRDLLAAAMLRLDAHGYNIILHVHDEIVCEVPGSVENSAAQVEKMTAIMNQVPGWAADFPVKVQCEAMARYGV